jgi:hypothetical protein
MTGLCALVGELPTRSREFRTEWAAHHVRVRHHGIKRLQHPEVGRLELYRSMDLPLFDHAVHDLAIYTAEPGTPSEDQLKPIAGWAATQPSATNPRDGGRETGRRRLAYGCADRLPGDRRGGGLHHGQGARPGLRARRTPRRPAPEVDNGQQPALSMSSKVSRSPLVAPRACGR